MPGISLNIIRVGWEQFTATDESIINNAINALRTTYATVGLSPGASRLQAQLC